MLERTLRLLHPFMPFITEEIWQNLLHRLPREDDLPDSIMVASYPKSDRDRVDLQAGYEMGTVIRMIQAVRNVRAQLRIPPGQSIEALVQADGLREAVEEQSPAISTLARIEPLRILADVEGRQHQGQGIVLVIDPLVVRLPIADVVDLSAERARLGKELEECVANLGRVQGLLSNADFASKAPEEVVEREQERLRSLQEHKERLEEVLSQLQS